MTIARRSAVLGFAVAMAAALAPGAVWAQSPDNSTSPKQGEDASNEKPKLTPEQKMQRRFPQPVRTGDLIGLPLLDENDSTIGYIQDVVRSPEGKIKLIVPYGKLLGWARLGLLDRMRKPVAVPLEVVAILAKQVDALDMTRPEFDAAPAWQTGSDTKIPPNETIRIAIQRR